MRTLLEIINETLDDSGRGARESLSRGERLREDLGFDSLELAVLTVRIEAECGVDVFADSIVNTIGEIEDKIDGR